MNNLTKILVFISLFTMVVMFTGAVSAANCTGSSVNNIQASINDTPNDTIVVNNTNKSFHTSTKNLNDDISQKNTTGIIMANTDHNCGPAALATVVQNYFDINITQDQLATLAGTDGTGTTMYGLAQAAQSEGLFAYGMSLSVDNLQSGNIVYLTIGEGQYSVITNITNKTVYLADPSIGNINMTMANFKVAYSGDALVITNNSNDKQLASGTILSNEEMQKIKGMRYTIDWPRTGLKILGCAGIGAGIATGNPCLIFAGVVTVYEAQWG
ncbi:cysteine peptidase family C39 domain-containing protein [Methanobacterium sp.]|uniref:cysteine peptidase family C39 domain-containing protein n=1 Tax=Methanobacterium sp. TaxID=2164 RepID=UPI003158DB40